MHGIENTADCFVNVSNRALNWPLRPSRWLIGAVKQQQQATLFYVQTNDQTHTEMSTICGYILIFIVLIRCDIIDKILSQYCRASFVNLLINASNTHSHTCSLALAVKVISTRNSVIPSNTHTHTQRTKERETHRCTSSPFIHHIPFLAVLRFYRFFISILKLANNNATMKLSF